MHYSTFISMAMAIAPFASALPHRQVLPRQYGYGYNVTSTTPLSTPTPTPSSVATADGTCGTINQATYDDLKQWEGAVTTIYNDQVGQATIGVGHLCKDTSCSDVPYPIPLSDADMESLLQSDLQQFLSCVSTGLSSSVTLNGNQFGALVSFAFNQGCGTWGSSSILSRLNAGDDPNTVASDELPKYTSANGQFVQDLVTRRENEVGLFTTPSSDVGVPC